MKVLFIGGTGTISTAISRQLLEQGHELYLLNRGTRNDVFSKAVKEIRGDINNEADIVGKIKDHQFDVVADFIAFTAAHAERDYRLFKGKTKQYLCFSSASAYQKPLQNYLINESTPLANPYWQYSRDKIALEDFLIKKNREEGYPITIVRPSHTYDERSIPLGVHGKNGSWQVAKRILDGKPVIIHGDGTSLWTMTHNSDFARGFIGLMGNAHAIGEAVGITSDETVTWNQVYAAIAAALDRPLKAVHVSSEFLAAVSDYDLTGGLIGDKANSVVFDNTKLKRLVPGFTATVRFDQGIRKTIENVLAHKELQIEDPEFDAWCDRVIAALEKATAEVRG
ncbi:SDR family oxidoreductase [Treponema primitia]|uniref:SDR family oxidoreductase n=1 Tax=Treponema primitia TaxID=88058 RepID=UPI000255590B|nr:SDR family oxidoreductase [Treponema primitia]